MVTARCTCGYTKFGLRVERTTEPAAVRWRPVPASGGLGATPVGFAMGAAQQGYGRFELSVMTGVAAQFCESCLRVRRGTPVGGGVAMASYVEGAALFAVMTDVRESSCITAHFTLVQGESYDAPIEVIDGAVPPVAGSPLEVRTLLPSNAVVAGQLYRIPIPVVRSAGVYDVTLVDRCLGTTQQLGALTLSGDLTLYGRTGDVVPAFGDYAASFLATDASNLALDLNALQAAFAAKVRLGGDLAGSVAEVRVARLQGRSVANVAPLDGANLRWSAANNRWEPG